MPYETFLQEITFYNVSQRMKCTSARNSQSPVQPFCIKAKVPFKFAADGERTKCFVPPTRCNVASIISTDFYFKNVPPPLPDDTRGKKSRRIFLPGANVHRTKSKLGDWHTHDFLKQIRVKRTSQLTFIYIYIYIYTSICTSRIKVRTSTSGGSDREVRRESE
jgi:hypothetical protein